MASLVDGVTALVFFVAALLSAAAAYLPAAGDPTRRRLWLALAGLCLLVVADRTFDLQSALGTGVQAVVPLGPRRRLAVLAAVALAVVAATVVLALQLRAAVPWPPRSRWADALAFGLPLCATLAVMLRAAEAIGGTAARRPDLVVAAAEWGVAAIVMAGALKLLAAAAARAAPRPTRQGGRDRSEDIHDDPEFVAWLRVKLAPLRERRAQARRPAAADRPAPPPKSPSQPRGEVTRIRKRP